MAVSSVNERPRIGLVLAGGGAKGGAHVGVLKVLEQLRVPIDCIAGTSMGALVGAGYASGLPAAEIERFVLDIDWPAVLGGAGTRRLEPAEQKRLAGAAGSRLEVGLHGREIVTRSGLVDSSAIEDVLRSFVAHSRGVADFNRLPIPFRAVATDMVNGEMVVLDHGDLATAMRASMAIPGAFSPVIQDAQVLADGGIVRNIPVDVARNTCADVVIVVVLVKPRPLQEALVQPRQLIARSTDVMIRANEGIQLATLGERDVRIDVPMGDIGTADFERMPETIPLGEAAAAAATARLAALALPEAEYRAWRRGVTTSPGVKATLADVRFEGLERVNPAYLRGRTAIRPGDAVDAAMISADAKRLSVLDEIDSVSYRLEGEADDATLVWEPKEIAIGPDVLRPSLGFFGDGGGDLKFQLGVQHVRHWVNRKGAQWRNTAKLGYETLLATSLYQPLDVAQRFFVEPGLQASRSIEELYLDGDHVATYRFVDAGGQVDLGWNPSPSSQLRLGYWASDRQVDVETGQIGLPEADLTDAGLTLSARYDSRDAASLAARGVAAAFEYQRADDALGSDRDWERVEAGIRAALPFGRRVFWLSLAGGADLGDELPADRAFSLGGPRTLPAFQLDEIRAREYWLAETNFVWRLKEISPIWNKAIYGGFGIHAAGLYERVDPVDDGEVYGVSAYLAGPTRIGTLALGAGANSEAWSVWLSLGRPVGKGSILDDDLFR